MSMSKRNASENQTIIKVVILNLSLVLLILFAHPISKDSSWSSFGLLPLLLGTNLTFMLVWRFVEHLDFHVVYWFKKSGSFLINLFLLVTITYTFGSLLGVQYFDQPIILFPIFSFALINLLFFQSFFNNLAKGKERSNR